MVAAVCELGLDVQLRACLELVVVMCTTVPMHDHALGICTNATSDKGCYIWVMIGSAMATAPRQMMLYSCKGSTGVSTVE